MGLINTILKVNNNCNGRQDLPSSLTRDGGSSRKLLKRMLILRPKSLVARRLTTLSTLAVWNPLRLKRLGDTVQSDLSFLTQGFGPYPCTV